MAIRASAANEKLKSLQRKYLQLAREEAKLAKERNDLLLKNAILTALCEALALLQRTGMAGEVQAAAGVQAPQAAAEAAKFAELLQLEMQLLRELTVSNSLACCSVEEGAAAAAAAAPSSTEQLLPDPGVALSPGDDALSPGDPMHYFRVGVAEGPVPEAKQWSSKDVAAMLRETVLVTSLHFRQSSLPGADPTAPTPAKTKEMWDRYLRVLMSLIMFGKEHVAEGISCFNLETLESSPEHALASERVTASLPPRMNLTDVQKDLISMGSEVVEGLVKALHTDREELMSQMEAAVAAAKTATAAVAASAQVGQHNSSSGSQRSGSSHYPPLNQAAAAAAVGSVGAACVPDSSSMSSLAGPSTSSVPLTVLKDRQQLLDMQQQLAARLKLLMAKEYMLMFTLVGFMVGCLTYDQICLCSVLAWPYSVRMFFLAQDIRKFREQELKQPPRQQRQQTLQQEPGQTQS